MQVVRGVFPIIDPKAQPFFLNGSQKVACLFIHGFTAAPAEVYPVARLINEMSGYTICGPLLPGHGTTPEKLNQTDWQIWFQTVKDETINLLADYDKVFIVGLSMGGLLALHAGYTIPGIKGVVSINAPLFNKNPLLTALAPIIKNLSPYYPKKIDQSVLKLEKQGRFAYHVHPLQAFSSMMKLRHVVMNELGQINIPVLVMQSINDESVRMKSALYIRKKTGARIIDLPLSRHVATMGPEKELIAHSIIDFVEESNEF
jgi:carboxylesterase